MITKCPDCGTTFVAAHLHREDCMYSGYDYKDLYRGVTVGDFVIIFFPDKN